MSILIDSMLWIYSLDPNAKEYNNVKDWLRGQKGVLKQYNKIYINTIIALEVLHALNKNLSLDYSVAYNATQAILALENIVVDDLDQIMLKKTIDTLQSYRNYGIGARDAAIITTLQNNNVQLIATDDKNILSVKNIKRIDPVLNPPYKLDIGEKFDEKFYKTNRI